jgi:redox-sensitive bicupin YhaK (pirin superfamily)
VYRGGIAIGGTRVPVQRMAILANVKGRDGVVLTAPADSRALLIAGAPLNEPIAQYGPFVMNSHEEIFAAVRDFQSGRFGQAA